MTMGGFNPCHKSTKNRLHFYNRKGFYPHNMACIKYITFVRDIIGFFTLKMTYGMFFPPNFSI